MEDQIDWLYNDLAENRAEIENNDSQLARRNFLRSLIAYYEINLSKIRETVIKLLTEKYLISGQLDLHEIYPLMDESARITGNGYISLDPNKTSLKSMLAYTIKKYAELVELDEELLSDHRWESYRKSINIRHRITHPKFHEDIEITDEELIFIYEGLEWWNKTLKTLYEAHYQKKIKPVNIEDINKNIRRDE